jgi:hypothetical protein
MGEPQIVYHYTSAEALLKIVDKNSIWATDIRYLNDVKEREHCLNMMGERLPEFLKIHEPQCGHDLATALSKIDNSEWHIPYIASFSRDADSLPQWRSYCPNGNGVSISFRVEALKGCTLTKEPIMDRFPPPQATLAPVQYLADNDVQMVDSLLNDCIKELEDWHHLQSVTPIEEKTRADDDYVLTSIMSRKCSLVKHASFSSEMEYRLTAPISLFSAKPMIQVRASRTTVIPYKVLLMPDWGKSQYGSVMAPGFFKDYFIEHIMVGPTPNPELTIGALSQFFISRRLAISMRKTSIPYRDL